MAAVEHDGCGRNAAMTAVTCWRCGRRVAEAEGVSAGTRVTVQCKRCSAQVVISVATIAAQANVMVS